MKRFLVFLLSFVVFWACSKDDAETTTTPPQSLSYNANSVFVKDVAIVDLHPTVSGGAVASYSIRPELPAGLSLNTRTGVISGTPTDGTPSTTYTITASNSEGSVATQITFSVNVPVTTPISRLKEIYVSYANPQNLVYETYRFTYDNGLLSTENYVYGGTIATIDNLSHFLYNSGKITSIEKSRSYNGASSTSSIIYYCYYTAGLITLVTPPTATSSNPETSYSYNSLGQLTRRNNNTSYLFDSNGNLYKTSIYYSGGVYRDYFFNSYDNNTNPYRIGGITTEYKYNLIYNCYLYNDYCYILLSDRKPLIIPKDAEGFDEFIKILQQKTTVHINIDKE